MRKSIVVLIAAVLLIAAGVAAWMWSSPLLDEEAEYEVTSLYRYGQNITGQVDGDDVVDLLREESRSTLPRGGLAAHAYTELIEINLMSGEEPLHVVLSEADGVYVMYRDPDWVYSIRDGEHLAADMEALLPQ